MQMAKAAGQLFLTLTLPECSKPQLFFQIGKTKLTPLIPALIRDFLLNEERGTPLRVEAVKLTNVIFGETVYDEKNETDAVSLALKEFGSFCREDNMEHQLGSAGDFELQAGLVELIFHLIPEMVRQEKAHMYFSNSSVAQAFSDINSSEFEAGCRFFLNKLNQSLKEKQSVASFPCCSATFGTAEVYPPIDPKISEFWVDFNLKSKSISLYVEERDDEGNCKEGNSLWELLLIKAEIVQDYRLTGTGKHDIVLLLKLRISASDVVTFLHNNHSQYVKITFSDNYSSGLSIVLPKILGRPKYQNQNSSGESDVNSTPSKASVAINPVHIRSRSTEKAYVMPTASLMLQLSDGTTDHEEQAIEQQEKACQSIGTDIKRNRNSSKKTQRKDLPTEKDQTEDENADNGHGSNFDAAQTKKNKRIPDESVSQGEDDGCSNSNKQGTEVKHRKQASKHLTYKVNSRQDANMLKHHQFMHAGQDEISEDDDENDKSDSSGKSYPAAFNVSGRLAASKRKSIPTMYLSEAAKRRKAIEKRVFSKPVSSPPVSEDIEEISELHMVTPARRREPRSGAISSSKAKDGDVRNKDDQTVIIQDSLPLADSFKDRDESAQRREKKSGKKHSVPVENLTKERQKKKATELNSGATDKKMEWSKAWAETSPERPSMEIRKSSLNRDSSKMVHLAKQQELQDTYNLDVLEASNEFNDTPDQISEGYGHTDDELTDCYVEEAIASITSPIVTTTRLRTRGQSPMRKFSIPRHLNLGLSPFGEAPVETSLVAKKSRNDQGHTGNDTGNEDEGHDSEEEFDLKSTELDYDFNVTITPRLKGQQTKRRKTLQRQESVKSGSIKRSVLLNDSGIGETPFGREIQHRTKFSRKSWQPLTPLTPRLEQGEDNSGDDETDEGSVRSPGTPEQQTLDVKHRKKKFVDWSSSGPSMLYDLSVSGVRPSRKEGTYKEPLHMSEAHMLSYRSQQFGKPRKLLYGDEHFNVQEGEELINDTSEEDIRNEVQGLIKIAGGEVFKAVRRKRQMIKSFLVRTTEMVLSSNDTFRNEQQATSYNAIKSYKNQLTEQIHSLEKDFGKTASTIKEMENTVNTFQNTFAKQFKILKGQRQIEEKRFKGVHHLQKLMETELNNLERSRNAREETFRAELERETLKFKKKFLQDTRKQKEDQLKMMLNILRIP
ncbi:synaptonemal complex protein 2-like isoform X4 [Montipora foliosa]|uniref:synaptonemal complex protein 2-like isoform X4 n=1 Tax=Montipora foliosa TaxID=591990 RepID=UPI0035F1542E